MIHPLDNSSAPSAPASKSSAGGSAGRASFASELASASKKASGSGTGKIVGNLNTDLKPPKGETWAPVPGHSDYADILDGPRDGFYVSLRGPRKGQVFVIVHKGGKTYHVYGEGRHKKYIPVATDPAELKPPKGETWKPVGHHHDFKQIHGGKHNHEYVNLSGNVRTGKVFTIEHHDGKTWHVYGSGKERFEVAVGGHGSHDHQQAPQQPPQSQPPQATNGNPSGPG